MDFWARLVGSTPKRTPAKTTANDPELRYAKFKKSYDSVIALCNKPRNLATEGPLLDQLNNYLERISLLVREESRAAAPHYVIQYAAANKIYAVITRAATASQHEPIIRATVSVLGAFIDSEEEDFLANATFAKSVMRMATRVLDPGSGALISVETETAILELLFTVAAKIRLQPSILSNWFHSTAKPELEDVFVNEKKSFAGITAKEDFPLCYLLIDRVHHEGRLGKTALSAATRNIRNTLLPGDIHTNTRHCLVLGDFARTGLLYVFEATGRSSGLEEWVVSSDLPTLMASGLGALYSQLSRELSILHPDATLPAVLAMSDYTTTHPRATAESAFSNEHRRDMATFLASLAFWQDVLDHCRSADVKQTLLDHFQILFLQQLLYPSLLQSSDTDAGSSVAVLTYVTAMLENLEYPDLMNMMLEYLLAIGSGSSAAASVSASQTDPPRSPTALRRKQSLILLAAPKNPDDAVDPALFSLVDLILNNISSKNNQSVFAALKLASTILKRQKRFALGSLLRVQKPGSIETERTAGALGLELQKFGELATSIHDNIGLEDAFAKVTEDSQTAIEAQIPFKNSSHRFNDADHTELVGRYILSSDDQFLRSLRKLLGTFLTNSVDVNLALTQALVSIALCVEIRLDGWLSLDRSTYVSESESSDFLKSWQSYLDGDEKGAYIRLQQASRSPEWSPERASPIWTTLRSLVDELDLVRTKVQNLAHLISVRKTMLQATSLDTPLLASNQPSVANSPTQAAFLDVPTFPGSKTSPGSSRSSSHSRHRSNEVTGAPFSQTGSSAASPIPERTGDKATSPKPPAKPLFLPPPPELPSTTDVLMQEITLPSVQAQAFDHETDLKRKATLNHILTNVVILQEFVLELVAILQARAAVLGSKEIRLT